MKKTNILLVLVLILNAVILWKVWCGGCGKHDSCTHNTECAAESCEHGDKKCDKTCEHGDHAKCCKHEGSEKCCKGKAGDCKHGSSCTSTCDSTCKANQSITMMLMKMPEEHMAETKTWMKDSLGLTDEQMTQIHESVTALSAEWETSNSKLKASMASNDETIKGMLSAEQLKMVENMMAMHCHSGNSGCCKKKCCKGSKCKHEKGNHNDNEKPAKDQE